MSPTTPAPSPFAHIDHKAFAADVEALHKSLKADLGLADCRHLLRMVWWSRACTALGYAFAWIIPNPVSALLMGLGNMGRWTCVTHPVMHRGYDAVPGVPRTAPASASRRAGAATPTGWTGCIRTPGHTNTTRCTTTTRASSRTRTWWSATRRSSATGACRAWSRAPWSCC